MSLEHTPAKAGYSVKSWCAEAGISHTTMYAEIKAGRVVAKKCGAKTLIVTSPAEWLASLPDLEAA